MTTSAERFGGHGKTTAARVRGSLRADATRTIQVALGLIWLLDGILQFQSWMYSPAFIQMLRSMAMQGQPQWLNRSVLWGANLAVPHLTLYNTAFASVQVLIGLGLLFRPTVRVALAVSFLWVAIVWWFGEAFGMLFMNAASPLTGAPGAVLLYGVIGAMVWPNGRPGGLLGVRGARATWAGLWLLMAWLWLLAVNSSANATRDAILATPSGMGWLTSLNHRVAADAAGRGLAIAIVLAGVSAAIAVAVGSNRLAKPFLLLSIVLNLGFWVVGQGFGGIATDTATDPNAAPLFILMACVLWALVPAAAGTPPAASADG